jgi:UTP-glucose-1-phosphate uridylyltransferase
MTPKELFEALDKLNIDYEVMQIFDGIRSINFIVDEEEENES